IPTSAQRISGNPAANNHQLRAGFPFDASLGGNDVERDCARFHSASLARIRAQLRAPLRNELRLYFSLGEWMRSSSRPKPTSRLSMPSVSLKEVTIGIEPPMPISAVGRPHSSSSASAARVMCGDFGSKAMALEPRLPENSARQSFGSRSLTKLSMALRTFLGS